ncbi:hypothetical protein [Lacisediminimonas profundi]|uniref:hypothetical protein n=1 Tax=Lacisediminimonas profundi TaxID=2603856 RepID=UPI00124AFCC5|nr:hypothetical protein [Lacisediminimonas profundi]
MTDKPLKSRGRLAVQIASLIGVLLLLPVSANAQERDRKGDHRPGAGGGARPEQRGAQGPGRQSQQGQQQRPSQLPSPAQQTRQGQQARPAQQAQQPRQAQQPPQFQQERQVQQPRQSQPRPYVQQAREYRPNPRPPAGSGWHGDIRRFPERDAHRWERGEWRHEHHAGRDGWWWIVAGLWYWYPAPVYPYPDPYIPPMVQAPPPPVTQAWWYYCRYPAGYYPYVQQCYVEWQPVPAR